MHYSCENQKDRKTRMCVCECVSFSYTAGVRGPKWSSGAQKAAFSSRPLITSQAVRASDRRCLSFPPSTLALGKRSLRKLSPHLWPPVGRVFLTERSFSGSTSARVHNPIHCSFRPC